MPITAPLNHAACRIAVGTYHKQRTIATNPMTITPIVGRLAMSSAPDNNWYANMMPTSD